MSRYRFVEVESRRVPVGRLCRRVQVSGAAYYAWKVQPVSARAHADAALTAKIRAIHTASDGQYGVPRVLPEMHAQSETVGRKRVARLMKAAGLRGRQPRGGVPGAPGVDGTTIPCVSVVGTDVIFEGCNVHVRDSSGTTDGATNGLGNLIVGYNEDDLGPVNARNGSHNLFVGPEHTYSSFGGFVAGRQNSIAAMGASVSGGLRERRPRQPGDPVLRGRLWR